MNCKQCKSANVTTTASGYECSFCHLSWPIEGATVCGVPVGKEGEGPRLYGKAVPRSGDILARDSSGRVCWRSPAEEPAKPQDTPSLDRVLSGPIIASGMLPPSLGDIVNGGGERITVTGDAKITNDGVIEIGEGRFSITFTPRQYGNFIDGEWVNKPEAKLGEAYVPNPDIAKLREKAENEVVASALKAIHKRGMKVPEYKAPNPTVNWRVEPTEFPPKPSFDGCKVDQEYFVIKREGEDK